SGRRRPAIEAAESAVVTGIVTNVVTRVVATVIAAAIADVTGRGIVLSERPGLSLLSALREARVRVHSRQRLRVHLTIRHPPSIPGMEPFIRRQRNPAHIAESEREATAAAPADESDHRGPPVVAAADGARIPSPSVAAHIPVAIVIRSPAPRIGADPGPSVVR